MNKYLYNLFKHQKLVFSFLTLVTILFFLPLLSLKNDNSLEVWLDKKGDDYVTYREFIKEFHVQDFIIAAIEGIEYNSNNSQNYFNLLSKRLSSVEGVSSAYHLNDFSFLFLFPEEQFTDLLISQDRKVYAFWLPLEKTRERLFSDIIKDLEIKLTETIPAHASFYMAGPPVLNAALDDAAKSQSRIFFPLVAAISALILFILFRNIKILVIAFILSGICLIWTLGLISLTGHSMNMVTTALPPLLWVLSLSTFIYMTTALQREGEINKAVMRVFKPCSLTIITTAFGFLSLTLSHIEPVKEMGIFTFVGLFISLIISFTLAPLLLNKIKLNQMDYKHVSYDHKLGLVVQILEQYKTAILIGALIITAVSLMYMKDITMATNNLEFFPKDSQVYKDYMVIGERLTGHSPLEIVISCSDEKAFYHHSALVSQLEKALTAFKGVKRVITYKTFGTMKREDTEIYVNEDSLKIRLSVLTDYLGTKETRNLISEIKEAVTVQIESHGEQKESFSYSITGVVPLLVTMQSELLQTQIKSFLLALAFIALIFQFLFRNIHLTLAAMIPNIFPLIFNLGIMGFFGIHLNVATVMIASVAIGIAVDDSIHFIVRYRECYENAETVPEAIKGTLEHVGRPVIFTTLINTFGFSILIFSYFMPLKYFGILMVLTLGSALVADLMILPSLLLRFSRWIHG